MKLTRNGLFIVDKPRRWGEVGGRGAGYRDAELIEPALTTPHLHYVCQAIGFLWLPLHLTSTLSMASELTTFELCLSAV